MGSKEKEVLRLERNQEPKDNAGEEGAGTTDPSALLKEGRGGGRVYPR